MSGATRVSQTPKESRQGTKTLKAKAGVVGVSNWVGLKPTLPDALIFRGAKKPIWDDDSKEVKSIDKDEDAFILLSYSHFDGVSYKPLDEGLHSPNSFSVCEDVLNDIIFEVIKINDKTEHRVAIKKLMEELFRKAELSLIEEVSNLHEHVD